MFPRPARLIVALFIVALISAGMFFRFRSQTAKMGAKPGLVHISQAVWESAAIHQDWPAFHGGGPMLGEAPPIHAPPMKVRWKFQTGDDVSASVPATLPSTAPTTASANVSSSQMSGTFEGSASIVGESVYVADTSGTVRSLDLQTGKARWNYHVDSSFNTTPLIGDGRVLLGDMDGMFYAISADSGKELWKFDTSKEIHASANFLGDDRKQVVFGTDGEVFCLDAASGRKIWSKQTEAPIYGTPAVSHGSALVSGCDSQLRAIKGTDGTEEFAIDLGAMCPGSTAVAGNRFVLGTDGGRVVCISAETHKQLWLFEGIEDHAMVFSSPAVSEGVVVMGARDRRVYGIDLITGKKLWSFTTRGDVDSSPVVSAGRVYVGSKDKRLYVLDLKTGKELWTFTAGRGIVSTPAIGQGVLVIGDTGGNLFCLE